MDFHYLNIAPIFMILEVSSNIKNTFVKIQQKFQKHLTNLWYKYKTLKIHCVCTFLSYKMLNS